MRRKFQTINSTKFVTWNRDANMTVRVNYINWENCIYKAFNVERVTILDIDMTVFESIALSKKLYLQCALDVERVMISNCFRIDLSSEELHCRVVDRHIFSRCTICSKLDHFFVTRSMSYSWYVNSTSEAFFFLLVWTFSATRRDVNA